VEYKSREEAEAAIAELNGTQFLDKTIHVTWAFVKPPRGGQRRPARR
jgi:RNA-binding protein 8A